MKVKIQLIKTGYEVIADIPEDTKLARNFTLRELANNEGNPKLPQMIINSRVDTFLRMIQDLREWYKKPMIVNSCYRQPDYNRSKGGLDNSLHLLALALDWGVMHTEQQRAHVTEKWREICNNYGRIGSIIYYDWGYHLSGYEDLVGTQKFTIRDYRKKGK